MYSDLITIVEDTLKIQRARDMLIHKTMVEKGFPSFPMFENDVIKMFPFFQAITSKSQLASVLNILLVYKVNGRDYTYIVVRKGILNMYYTQQDAINSMRQTVGLNYGLITSPVVG